MNLCLRAAASTWRVSWPTGAFWRYHQSKNNLRPNNDSTGLNRRKWINHSCTALQNHFVSRRRSPTFEDQSSWALSLDWVIKNLERMTKALERVMKIMAGVRLTRSANPHRASTLTWEIDVEALASWIRCVSKVVEKERFCETSRPIKKISWCYLGREKLFRGIAVNFQDSPRTSFCDQAERVSRTLVTYRIGPIV